MNDNKISANDIKKALYHLKCAAEYKDTLTISKETVLGIEEYITLLEGENETLRTCVSNNFIIRKDGKSPLSLLKVEAYKEFAESVYKEINILNNEHFENNNLKACEVLETVIKKIKEIYKEMVGDDDVRL